MVKTTIEWRPDVTSGRHFLKPQKDDDSPPAPFEAKPRFSGTLGRKFSSRPFGDAFWPRLFSSCSLDKEKDLSIHRAIAEKSKQMSLSG